MKRSGQREAILLANAPSIHDKESPQQKDLRIVPLCAPPFVLFSELVEPHIATEQNCNFQIPLYTKKVTRQVMAGDDSIAG